MLKSYRDMLYDHFYKENRFGEMMESKLLQRELFLFTAWPMCFRKLVPESALSWVVVLSISMHASLRLA